MKNKIVYTVLTTLLLIFPILGNYSLALAATSNSVITQVGNPTTPKPVIGGNLAKAAQDLVGAYSSCNGYADFNTITGNCFKGALRDEGYSSEVVDKIANFQRYTSPSPPCVTCIGFVIQAIVLAYGDADPGFGVDHVAVSGNGPFGWKSMNNNGHILNNIGTSDPRPGDIAVNNGDTEEAITPDHGHISVVVSVNGSKFTAAESNWTNSGQFQSCHISNNFEHPWVRHTYTFFREQ